FAESRCRPGRPLRGTRLVVKRRQPKERIAPISAASPRIKTANPAKNAILARKISSLRSKKRSQTRPLTRKVPSLEGLTHYANKATGRLKRNGALVSDG